MRLLLIPLMLGVGGLQALRPTPPPSAAAPCLVGGSTPDGVPAVVGYGVSGYLAANGFGHVSGTFHGSGGGHGAGRPGRPHPTRPTPGSSFL